MTMERYLPRSRHKVKRELQVEKTSRKNSAYLRIPSKNNRITVRPIIVTIRQLAPYATFVCIIPVDYINM